MKSRAFALVTIAVSLVVVPLAWAQREPRIGYVYPAGGKQGTTFEVTVAAQFLKEVTGVHFTGGGIETVMLEREKIISPKEATEMRDRLQELRKQEKTAEILAEAATIVKKLAALNKLRMTAPAIAETVPIRITLAADAAPGTRELRLRTPAGLSNPLVFQVGQLPEFREPVPKHDDAMMLRELRAAKMGNAPAKKEPELPTVITLPACVNGQILPGGVDKFRFAARAGQLLLVSVSARELIPYLADAVPGWFQAAMTLYDADGKELAYADDFRFRPDPVLFYKIPRNGEYVLEIKDALYRGREDFVYRITIGELPFVTSVFPLGGKVGTPAIIALSGWNLPSNQSVLDLRNKELGIHSFAVERIPSPFPFVVDSLTEVFESEPNNATDKAQAVTLPVVVNGRVDKPGDWDVFRFEGRAGDKIVAEVCARRLDSPLDSVLKLTDAKGQQLAFNDDHEDKAAGLNTHHADSYLTATLPANGAYFVHLGDTQHSGGAAFAYRLRLSAPRPDFELRIVPSAISARAGVNTPLTVFALRKDGFSGEIALALKDAPPDLKLIEAKIPAGQDNVKFTLVSTTPTAGNPLSLHIEGRATIQGREVVRQVVPADDMMQAFAYRHLVPAQTLAVSVGGKYMPWATAKILGEMPLKIHAGRDASLRVSVPPVPQFVKLEFELSDPPDGIAIKNVSPRPDTTEIVLQAEPRVKSGLKGNLIVKVFGERELPGDEKAQRPNRQRVPLGVLPAIPFEIIEP